MAGCMTNAPRRPIWASRPALSQYGDVLGDIRLLMSRLAGPSNIDWWTSIASLLSAPSALPSSPNEKPRRLHYDRRGNGDAMPKSNTNGRSKPDKCRENGKSRLNRYAVKFIPIDSITPSPENNDIYGPITHDDAMENLIDSIARKGLDEPILTTGDRERFILSGHRRYYAMRELGYKEVPVRVNHDIRREGNSEYHRELIEYNPQRVKTVGSILREALLRDNNAADTYAAIRERQEAAMTVDADFMEVAGDKEITPISERRQEFLVAVQRVIEELDDYLPVSIRQIHYRLLNNPPLKQVPERSKFALEHYRYKNDDSSYDSLVDLLTAARYHGQVSMACIDDPTRPQKTHGGFDSVTQFVQQEIDGFLKGFHRDRQQGQPRHIEVFGEKNTLFRMLERACTEYYVPFSIGRGFCSIPVWRDMAQRFRMSFKKRMTLIIVSDYDPEGLSLADDAIRSLELHRVPVDGHRIAVTREQIEDLELVEDFNPAKESSSRYNAFVEETGGNGTWEVEALPPDYLVEQIKAAIEANMDMETYNAICNQEVKDCEALCRIRREIADKLNI